MKHQKATKIRIDPTSMQKLLFARTEGACRWVYNWCIRRREETYREKKSGLRETALGPSGLSRELTELKRQEKYSWLKDVPAIPLQQKIRDHETAMKRMFKGISGRPSPHHKSTACAIRFQMSAKSTKMVAQWLSGALILPSIGRVKIAQPERLGAQYPKMITMSRDSRGRYFVSFMTEQEMIPLEANDKIVGVDLGVRKLATYSTGEIRLAHEANKKLKRKLKHEKRVLSRKQGAKKGQIKSNRYKKQAHKVNRIQARITDANRDTRHKLTNELTNRFGVVCIEDLNVKGMMASAKGTKEKPGKNVAQKRGLNRGLAVAGFGEIRRQLEYKSKWRGRDLRVISRWAPSSKTCGYCGYYRKELGREEHWCCPSCGTTHDRDLNAAHNIAVFALESSPDAMAGQAKSNARGGRQPPSASIPRNRDNTGRPVKRELKKSYQDCEVLPNEVGHRVLV